MIDELDNLMIDTHGVGKEPEITSPVSPISLIDAYIQTSDLPKACSTFRDGQIKRAVSLPKPEIREKTFNSMPIVETRDIEKPVNMIDRYIQLSDLADIGGNLSSFREVLILRGRITRANSLR
jgi:hypothetical protein